MSKLQNVNAVKQMLDGTHKMQTKKSFGFSQSQSNIKREVGDTWTEKDPKTGKLVDWVYAKEQTAQSMLKILGYLR